MNWPWWKKYVLNIDAIAVIVIASMVLYFILTSKRKKYKFDMQKALDLDAGRISPKMKKAKAKKVNKHEEETRRIFHEIFRVPFKSVRPNWLKNPTTNKNLELDGFNTTIETPIGKGLAFEYDGQQHAKYTPHFHKGGIDEFQYQIAKDSWKDEKCKQKGVLLIRIPHFVSFPDLERYIRMMLKRKGVEIYASGGFRDDPASVYKSFSSDTQNMYG